MARKRKPTRGRVGHSPLARWTRVLFGLLFGLPLLLWIYLQLNAGHFASVSVHGPALQGRADQGLEQMAKQWAGAVFTIRTGPYVTRATRAQLGARLPPAALQARVDSLGASGNPMRDLFDMWRHAGGWLQVHWQPELDRQRLGRVISRMRDDVERPPVPGTIGADGQPIEGIPGLTVNTVTAVSLVERALRAGSLEVELDSNRIAPPAPVVYDPGAGASGTALAQYETKYRSGGASWGRGQNIENAARLIDAQLLAPGQTFSFNEVVGERSFERGFRAAKELANRRVVDGIGGGVCQVAATLHAAAFEGGFDIVHHRPHSRPVRYITAGLDTMVSWPRKDLKFRNPYPFPVEIRATAVDGLVHVELVGAGRAHPVEWDKEIVETIKPGVKQLPDPALRAGESKVVQKAINGLVIRRRRVLYLPSGPKVEERTLRYPANPKIVMVGGSG